MAVIILPLAATEQNVIYFLDSPCDSNWSVSLWCFPAGLSKGLRPRPGPSLPCSVYQKLEERKVTTSEQPSSTTSLEKRERKEKLKKSVRNPMDEEKELKKERKLSRKRVSMP
ncbi:hypothetical protein J6590_048726 [Homalodisca vitripennis]|nr:hypothetical protein J6590_048726 [Homalodisca vitripennis]